MGPWQGALPSLYAAVAAEAPIAPHALDEAVAQELWHFAEQATGVNFSGVVAVVKRLDQQLHGLRWCSRSSTQSV